MKTTIVQPHKSSLGMDANVACLLIGIAMVILLWLPYASWIAFAAPLVFFFAEKNSRFVKYVAASVLFIAIAGSAIAIIIQIIRWIVIPRFSWTTYVYSGSWAAWRTFGVILYIIDGLITLLMAYVVYMAFTYKQIELPIVGPIAQKASEKLPVNYNQQGYNQQGYNQQGYGQQGYNQPPPNQYNPNAGQQAPGQYNPNMGQPPPQQQYNPNAGQPAPGQFNPNAGQQPPQQYNPNAGQQPPQQFNPNAGQQPPQQYNPNANQPPPPPPQQYNPNAGQPPPQQYNPNAGQQPPQQFNPNAGQPGPGNYPPNNPNNPGGQ